jgi:hypothetical protein
VPEDQPRTNELGKREQGNARGCDAFVGLPIRPMHGT